MNSRTLWLLGAGLLCMAGAVSAVETQGLNGANPHPVRLVRPRTAPLSAMAQLGLQIFYDASLSSSGALSCASCHSPEHHYGPPKDGPVMLGGASLSRQGARAVPSLTYLERQPNFSIGPEQTDDDNIVPLAQMAALGQQSARAKKTASGTAGSAVNIVPQGGLFWDGRADTLQDQALFPLLDPNEMDGGSLETVADKLRHAPYTERFAGLFGAGVFSNSKLLVSEAMFAVARYQFEDLSFHPSPANSTTGWRAGRSSARASCAASNYSTIPTRPIAAAAICRARPATACRRSSPTISTKRSARRATRTSLPLTIQNNTISAFAGLIAAT